MKTVAFGPVDSAAAVPIKVLLDKAETPMLGRVGEMDSHAPETTEVSGNTQFEEIAEVEHVELTLLPHSSVMWMTYLVSPCRYVN